MYEAEMLFDIVKAHIKELMIVSSRLKWLLFIHQNFAQVGLIFGNFSKVGAATPCPSLPCKHMVSRFFILNVAKRCLK